MSDDEYSPDETVQRMRMWKGALVDSKRLYFENRRCIGWCIRTVIDSLLDLLRNSVRKTRCREGIRETRFYNRAA